MTVVDTFKPPSPERSAAIREYLAEHDDRAETDHPNPLFAGREKVMRSTLLSLDRLIAAKRPMPNLTTVVYGAPGAGKSEILEQLRARVAKMATDAPVIAMDAGSAELTRASAFASTLARIAPEAVSRTRGGRRTRWDLEVGVESIRAKFRREVDNTVASSRSEIERLNNLADNLHEYGGDPPVIVMLIDEAQGELNDVARTPGNFVMPMHVGKIRLKVLPVCAGLGNTLDALRECGVTRLASGRRHSVGRLRESAARTAAAEALHALAGQGHDILGRWADKTVEVTQGWPMHMSHVFKAAAARARPERWALDDDGFKAALRDAEQERVRYYDDRLAACPALKRRDYRDWAKLVEGMGHVGIDSHQVSEALSIPEDQAETRIAQAVRAGLLEQAGGDAYTAPIPSLTDHIAARGAQYERRTKRAVMSP